MPLNKGLRGADEALCGPRADSGGDAMLPVAFLKGIPNKDLGECVHIKPWRLACWLASALRASYLSYHLDDLPTPP